MPNSKPSNPSGIFLSQATIFLGNNSHSISSSTGNRDGKKDQKPGQQNSRPLSSYSPNSVIGNNEPVSKISQLGSSFGDSAGRRRVSPEEGDALTVHRLWLDHAESSDKKKNRAGFDGIKKQEEAPPTSSLTGGKHSIINPNITLSLAPAPPIRMGDENENYQPQSGDDSDTLESEMCSEEDSTSEDSLEREKPMPQYSVPMKKHNRWHPLNWYTPTLLSPILDVSPSVEIREAGSSGSKHRTGSEEEDTESDVLTAELNDSTSGYVSKLKRSPAIIDFSDPGKMSRSTGDLPDNQPFDCVEDGCERDVSEVQALKVFMTKSESSINSERGLPRQPASETTNLLFEELSVPFYFTLPKSHAKKTSCCSLTESLDKTNHRQSRVSLVMSQILLKEELKEALCLQRSKLAECEIEADQRAVKVEQKLRQQTLQFNNRKGSLTNANGFNKTVICPEKHVYDGKWCSEPSLIPPENEKVLEYRISSTPMTTTASQTETTITETYVKDFDSPPSRSKRNKTSKNRRKCTVAVNTQITWRSLKSGHKSRSESEVRYNHNDSFNKYYPSNYKGFSGIAYSDLLDFSKNQRNCSYCNGDVRSTTYQSSAPTKFSQSFENVSTTSENPYSYAMSHPIALFNNYANYVHPMPAYIPAEHSYRSRQLGGPPPYYADSLTKTFCGSAGNQRRSRKTYLTDFIAR